MRSPALGSLPSRLGAAALATLASAVPLGTSAADAGTGSLCDALPLETLNALGPLDYRAPEFSTPTVCAYGAAGGGSYGLTLAISGISFDLMRTSEVQESAIAERPAIAFEGGVIVDLGESVLVVTPDFADAPEASGLDPLDYASAVAEAVVPMLGVTVAEAPVSSGLPDVAGIEWGRVSVEDLAEADADQLATWQPLLDTIGADAAQLVVVTANLADADSGDRLGTYSAIHVRGAEAVELRSATVDWMRAASGEDLGLEAIMLGGKAAEAVTVGGNPVGYLYVAGDTAYGLAVPEDVAARIVEALP
jgi:hypothetical protein